MTASPPRSLLSNLPDLPERLKQIGCTDIARATRNLEALGEHLLHREVYVRLVPPLLETLVHIPDPEMALNNLERFAGVVIDRGFLFRLLHEHRKSLDLLLTIFGSSQYLSDVLIRYPQLFQWLLEPGVLRWPIQKGDLARELAALTDRPSSVERKWEALRRFKMREILRIGLQDLLGNQDLPGITQELSQLAEVTLQKAYEISHADLTRRFGTPQVLGPTGEARECTFCIIGMGKLGGGELNYSSDIDILFVYEAEGETTGVSGPARIRDGKISNHQYFAKLAETIVKTIGTVTGDGSVFRVDTRLRPGGRQGDLCLSLRSYEIYYESWGQTWERQALIKARPVAGDEEFGRKFLQMVTPFIYRKYLDQTAIQEVRAMKGRIEQSLRHDRKLHRDVKRGYGGIREIEFIVQAFQLLYGGRDPWIRGANTLRTLHRLAARHYLSDEDCEALVKAYVFLRTVEHRLQIIHNLQTHTLPEGQRQLFHLARRSGYRTQVSSEPVEDILRDYRAHTHAVRRVYDAFFSQGEAPTVRIEQDEIALFFEGAIPASEIRERLQEIGFEDVERAYRNFQLLRDGPPFAHYSNAGRWALAHAAPHLMKALREAPDPDMALTHFEREVAAVGAQGVFLSILAEKPETLGLLFRLFGVSDFLARTLIQHPELVDLLLDSASLSRRKSRQEMIEELRGALRVVPAGSAKLDALRRFKKIEELRIGFRDVLGETDVTDTQAALTRLAEVCLTGALEMAWEELGSRYGMAEPKGFAILGMGKLGAAEMNYSSDLDIAFVTEDEIGGGSAQSVTPIEFFSKLADRVTKNLTVITREGSAYRVDSRLRPGGSKGPLAQSVAAFRDHFERWAEVWEQQAYTRARVVAGDEELGRKVSRLVREFVYEKPVPEELAQRIDAMRHRMEDERVKRGAELHLKLGSGGIVEVEFIVQYLQLLHGKDRAALRESNTVNALDALHGEGILSEEDFRALRESYRFLRMVENRLRIVADLSVNTVPRAPAKLEKLARRLGYAREGDVPSGERFLQDFAAHTSRVHAVYEKVFGRAQTGDQRPAN
ncbi:MAG: bifunctional [glutamate--ammonia ligase]-adenylyl-L-tyrosine phosphorylase/[glutamate--ammonia-ligase] adenylyltransferase [candidate division NC10 bacterium]|nr:bifunctional [glutamate--ammonia ligase]-adenylyl-L-tyrosine phosphorylase/[glutamate--ammonia-ligase] adenylyltransferase [candidate division NC10 bacterium]